MRCSRSIAAYLFACFLAVVLASPATAYINAGFQSEADYRRYQQYCLLVERTVQPFTKEIARRPQNPQAYRDRARAWRSLPQYTGPWPERQYEPHLDAARQASRDEARARALERENAQPRNEVK